MMKAGTYNRQKLIDDWYTQNNLTDDASAPDFDSSG